MSLKNIDFFSLKLKKWKGEIGCFYMIKCDKMECESAIYFVISLRFFFAKNLIHYFNKTQQKNDPKSETKKHQFSRYKRKKK